MKTTKSAAAREAVTMEASCGKTVVCHGTEDRNASGYC